MKALLNKYRANPCAATQAAVMRHHRKHPFAECLLSTEDRALLIELESQPTIQDKRERARLALIDADAELRGLMRDFA